MSLSVAIMYGVGVVLMLAGALAIARIFRAPAGDPRRVAFRIAGVMLAAGGCILVAYATVLQSWTTAPVQS